MMMTAFAVVPAHAKWQVEVPVINSAEVVEGDVVVCWSTGSALPKACHPAAKWSVVLFSTLTYQIEDSCLYPLCANGQMQIELEYNTDDADRIEGLYFDERGLCLYIDQALVNADFENMLESALGDCAECLAGYQSGTLYAKVKGLGPGKGKGRHNNVFSATIPVTIENAPNVAPGAVDDAGIAVAYGSPGTEINVLANDTDPDSKPSPISIQSFTQGAHGSVAKVGDKLVYTPAAGFSGADTFTYTITDGDKTDTATVTVNVAEEELPPIMGDVPNREFPSGFPMSWDLSQYVTTTNGDPILEYELTGELPFTVFFNSATGEIYSDGLGIAGDCTFSIRCRDNDGWSEVKYFTLTATW